MRSLPSCQRDKRPVEDFRQQEVPVLRGEAHCAHSVQVPGQAQGDSGRVDSSGPGREADQEAGNGASATGTGAGKEAQVKRKPHIFFSDGMWCCYQLGTFRAPGQPFFGYGYNPTHALENWREQL